MWGRECIGKCVTQSCCSLESQSCCSVVWCHTHADAKCHDGRRIVCVHLCLIKSQNSSLLWCIVYLNQCVCDLPAAALTTEVWQVVFWPFGPQLLCDLRAFVLSNPLWLTVRFCWLSCSCQASCWHLSIETYSGTSDDVLFMKSLYAGSTRTCSH